MTLPYEIHRDRVAPGQLVPVTDVDGALLGRFPVVKVKSRKKYPGTLLVQVKVNVPRKLTREQSKLVEDRARTLKDEKTGPVPRDSDSEKPFFDRVRDIFG